MNGKRMIDVDELREELGFSEHCENCKQDKRDCQYGYYRSLMDFCERLDVAIETILERNKAVKKKPLEPIVDSFLNRRCPKCNAVLKGRFCFECGQEVKWRG